MKDHSENTYSFWGYPGYSETKEQTIINVRAKNIKELKEICKNENIVICSPINKK
jgi:hypothetical protein